MGWSLTIARIAGTQIRIHITFLLFLAWIAFVHYQIGGSQAAVTGLLFITLLFLCVLLHELGHVLAAKRFGILTPDITLLPIGGVARMQRMPDKPVQEIVVAVAGPAVNLLIAGVVSLGANVPFGLSALGGLMGAEGNLAGRLVSVNLSLLLFNLIPAFPMDGGRVLRALLATRMEYGQATRAAARIGQGFAFLFGFLGLFGNPLLIFIALFIYLGASQEAVLASLKDLSRWMSVSDAMVTEFSTLGTDATVADAVEALLHTSQHEFPIVNSDGAIQGILTRDDLIKALREKGSEAPVVEAMRKDIPVVHQNVSFEEAFQTMQECHCPALAVVDQSGRLVGMVTPENVGELMLVHAAMPGAKGLAMNRRGRRSTLDHSPLHSRLT